MHAEHAADLVEDDVFGQRLADLLQGEAQVLQRQDAVQARELGGGVVAVAGRRIDRLGFEQPDVRVVAQLADRGLRDAGEVADLEHVAPLWPISRRSCLDGFMVRSQAA